MQDKETENCAQVDAMNAVKFMEIEMKDQVIFMQHFMETDVKGCSRICVDHRDGSSDRFSYIHQDQRDRFPKTREDRQDVFVLSLQRETCKKETE